MQVNKRIIFTGAEIVTLTEELPLAEAVSVAGGRIECVGSRREVLDYARGGDFTIVDLEGGVLHPGFIDTHSHLSMLAVSLSQVRCGPELGSVGGVLEALRRKAARLPEGEWVVGMGYDDLAVAEGRHLTRQDLDAVSKERPVFVKHVSTHVGYANTACLNALGFTPVTRIPGGEVRLDSRGELSGVLLENAAFEAFERLPKPSVGQLAANLKKAVALYSQQGFTTFMDGGVGYDLDATIIMNAYARLARSGELEARAYLQLVPDVLDRLIPYGLWNLSGEYLSLGGVKYFVDGAYLAFTAALFEDYLGRPGCKGDLLFSVTEIETVIKKYHKMGIQVAVHVNGDRSLEVALAAFEKAVAEHPRTDLRHMLIHAQLVTDERLARMKACGIIPSFFPPHISIWGDRHWEVTLGPERAARLDPAGSCVKLGLPFGLHSDTPVAPITALGCMDAAVNRKSPGGRLLGGDQRIAPLEALKAYTVYAARCCAGERDRGRIAPGYYADFVLLSDNLASIAPERLGEVQVLMTVCGGKVVFKK